MPKRPRDYSGESKAYELGRERILGAKLSLSRDPEVAFEELAQQLGGTWLAERWLDRARARRR